MMAKRWLAAVAAALILPACGGDGGSRSENPDPADPDIETFPSEGTLHVDVGTVLAYDTDPPTSGPHYPVPQDGGFFETAIDPGYLVHSLEHGAVIIYYNPATVVDNQIKYLKQLAKKNPGNFSQVICVPRDDATYPIILTAWTHRLRLTAWDQDRIDGFIALYLGEGPEPPPM